MQLNKIKITSSTAHFGKPLGRNDRYTYDIPPPSTILGMLKVMYGEKIDNFIFGYTFKSEAKYIDDITIYKHTNKGLRLVKNIVMSDCRKIEYHSKCKLTIYTSINEKIIIKDILSIGKANSPARIHFPVKKINLVDINGIGFNQYTTKNIGDGLIEPINLKSKYNLKLNAYDNQIAHLRLNKKFKYNKNHDIEEKQNVFLWKCENGVVKSFDS